MVVRRLTLALLLAALVAPVHAQAPAEPEISTVVEALEVVAKAPGPAMWRVSRGDSQVVIMGTVSPVAHLLAWDDRRLRRNLTGARQLLVPSRPVGSAKAMLDYALGDRGKIRVAGKTTLEDRLPPDLAARFAGAVAASHQPLSKYDRWKPAAAGVMLLGDFDRAAGLSRGKPIITVTRLAQTMKVPVTAAGKVDIAKVLGDGARLNDAQNIACLAVAVEQVGRLAGAPGELGKAWAAGDLRAVQRLYTPRIPDQCPLLNPVLDKEVAASADLVEDALKTPGRSVALIDMSLLLRPGGVLDRLSEAGDQIDTP
jgi:hypothetical protein